MNQHHARIFCRILTVLLVVLVFSVIAFAIYIFINRPDESATTEQPATPELQEFREVVFEGDTEYGHETCFDNNICVVSEESDNE